MGDLVSNRPLIPKKIRAMVNSEKVMVVNLLFKVKIVWIGVSFLKIYLLRNREKIKIEITIGKITHQKSNSWKIILNINSGLSAHCKPATEKRLKK